MCDDSRHEELSVIQRNGPDNRCDGELDGRIPPREWQLIVLEIVNTTLKLLIAAARSSEIDLDSLNFGQCPLAING